jgi:hypothetical protein
MGVPTASRVSADVHMSPHPGNLKAKAKDQLVFKWGAYILCGNQELLVLSLVIDVFFFFFDFEL